MTHVNPYSAPVAAVRDIEPGVAENEQLRRDHVRHEVLLKSVGSLYVLGCLLFSLAAVGIAMGAHGDDVELLAIVAVYAVLAVLAGVLAYGYRGLRSWVRYPGTAVSAIGLLGVPVGTLLHGYILYLMFCDKGRVVLGPGYRAVIAATPHIRYRRTVGDWIALGILIALVLGVVVLIAVNR